MLALKPLQTFTQKSEQVQEKVLRKPRVGFEQSESNSDGD